MTAELFNGFRNPEKALTGPPMKTFGDDNVGINFHGCFLSPGSLLRGDSIVVSTFRPTLTKAQLP
jgi:hypothetical protein